MCTVNQLNLTAVKFSLLTTQTYLAQENLAFRKILKKKNLNCLLLNNDKQINLGG